MELLDYIRKNYKTPNIAVLKTLGATDELIKYLVNTPNNTNIKVVESLINEGGGEAGNGIKSITISPAITTTPALDVPFPIYWEDLTDSQKQDGVSVVAVVGDGVITAGDEYEITVTPTDDLYAGVIGGEPEFGNKGEPMAFTVTAANNGNLGFTVVAVDNPDEAHSTIVVVAIVSIHEE